MAEAVVIVVDDDEAVRDSLQLMLEAEGFEPRAYESALQLLAEPNLPERGCLLLDVRMPGMDGLELQRALVDRKVTLPIIIMTGHGDVPIAVRAMKAGAADFVEKPFAADTIVAAIRQAIERSRPSAADRALTYCLGDHTTADDASRYRDDAEASLHWPEEPIARLRHHLAAAAGWTKQDEEDLLAEVAATIDRAAQAWLDSTPQDPLSIFDFTYAALPRDLVEQRQAAADRAGERG